MLLESRSQAAHLPSAMRIRTWKHSLPPNPRLPELSRELSRHAAVQQRLSRRDVLHNPAGDSWGQQVGLPAMSAVPCCLS